MGNEISFGTELLVNEIVLEISLGIAPVKYLETFLSEVQGESKT